MFSSRTVHAKLNKFFPVNILRNLLSPAELLGTFVFGSTQIFRSLVMSGISVRLVLFISGIFSDSEGITCDVDLLTANALVGSHFDYCNSLFRGFSTLDLRRLQYVQNSHVRIVANVTKYSHVTPVRKSLHWLPSVFKIALLISVPVPTK